MADDNNEFECDSNCINLELNHCSKVCKKDDDDSVLYKVALKDVNFKNMPNDNEFYFVIDGSYGKRIHRAIHIKTHPTNFKYIYLQKSQL